MKASKQRWSIMLDWLKAVESDVRWLMLVWVIALSVVVWLLDAPAWVAVIFGVWLLYKENE
jgi:hypothetical protein